jgi:hypothetical protein
MGMRIDACSQHMSPSIMEADLRRGSAMVPRRINVRVGLSGDASRTRPTTLKTARPQVRSEEIDAYTHVDRQTDRQTDT